MVRPDFIKGDPAKLYRYFTRSGATSMRLPQAEELLALTDGECSQSPESIIEALGQSGVHADLLHFSRDLQPESSALSAQLESLLDAPATSAHSRSRGGHVRHAPRIAATRRNRWLRAVAGLAAVLVASVFWSVQHRAGMLPTVAQSTNAGNAAPADRIFAALGSGDRANNDAVSDVIFRADFHQDEIFKSQFSGG